MKAAEVGQSGVVRILVESYGARVNDDDGSGATAPMFAAWDGHGDCIRELVRLGADINAADEDGWTAIAGALSFHENESAARVLFALGARIDIHPHGGGESSNYTEHSVAQLAIKKQLSTDSQGQPGPLGDCFAFTVFGKSLPLV